jgi:hypothetical protein
MGKNPSAVVSTSAENINEKHTLCHRAGGMEEA